MWRKFTQCAIFQFEASPSTTRACCLSARRSFACLTNSKPRARGTGSPRDDAAGEAACEIPKVGVFASEVLFDDGAMSHLEPTELAIVSSAFVGDHNVSDYGLPANPENLNAVCEAVYEKLLEVRKQFCL
ncbi:unnamed protein product [Mesocestoides corti]|uniref:Uncharacterized protein n=1 Tax=Mesocestoides corti TaxID=53468 RepID=A0A0R3UA05_MESCO|nr:unnamed protein product [Mesocestoides corti]